MGTQSGIVSLQHLRALVALLPRAFDFGQLSRAREGGKA